ncbi:MAG: hypothetical protein IT170_05170 [Bryobacterales bacterium]|nr:hypothetical protein [Bryobacterales bacterium]
MMRNRIGIGLMAVVALLAAGCGKNTSNTPPPDAGGPLPAASAPSAEKPPEANPAAAVEPAVGAAAQAGGLQWSVPENWVAEAERPMRAATYRVPAASGDAEAGECAVFYFGPNEGGGVDAKIDRWIGQMKQPDGSSSGAKAKTRKLNGTLPITLVDLTGTYMASGGPMMQVTAEKPGFRLMGAIVQGPQGAVFFKFTGPEKTVEANAAKFLAMVQATGLAK